MDTSIASYPRGTPGGGGERGVKVASRHRQTPLRAGQAINGFRFGHGYNSAGLRL